MFRSFAGLRRVPPHYRFLAIRRHSQQSRRGDGGGQHHRIGRHAQQAGQIGRTIRVASSASRRLAWMIAYREEAVMRRSAA